MIWRCSALRRQRRTYSLSGVSMCSTTPDRNLLSNAMTLRYPHVVAITTPQQQLSFRSIPSVAFCILHAIPTCDYTVHGTTMLCCWEHDFLAGLCAVALRPASHRSWRDENR